eukprot:gene5057-6158_t
MSTSEVTKYEWESGATYTAYTCVTAGSSFQLQLTSSTGNGWPSGSVAVKTLDGQVLASGPDGEAFSSQIVGPFRSVAAEEVQKGIKDYPNLESSNSGCARNGGDGCKRAFDGMWQPFQFVADTAAYVLVSAEAGGTDTYLYTSTVYKGYWIIGRDLQSKKMYGYAYDSAEVPTSISTGWSGKSVKGIEFNSLAYTPAPTASPTGTATVAPIGSPVTRSPTVSPTRTPTVSTKPPTVTPTMTPTGSPISKNPTEAPLAAADVEYHCPDGYTNVKAEMNGCDWMASYGCEDADSNAGKCKFCGKSAANGKCKKRKYAYATQTSSSPYMFQSCEAYGCTASMLDDDKCDSACNKPECGWDDGRCCPETMDNYQHGDTHPQVCFDPRYSENHNTWRFEFNVPECRAMPLNQGHCASCTSFATTTQAIHQACYNGEENSWRSLSPMYMDSCVLPLWNQGLCNGAGIGKAMSQMTFEGVPTNDCFPYAYHGKGTQHFEITEVFKTLEADGSCGSADRQFLQ